ncbi:threonine/serine exporter family protein [Nonomuraea sp. NPDC050310]|uniref:threonine/serine ThrE exporter family protein n=1 Tax=Nonomuraea sp. NPDC050310 TaxID=3154935 RepID=UPI00340F2892
MRKLAGRAAARAAALARVLRNGTAGRYARDQVIEVPGASTQADWNRRLAGFLCELGDALLRAGEQTSAVEGTLSDVAARYGVRCACFVVPTGLFVRVGEGDAGVMDFRPVAGDQLRLDQVQELYGLVTRLRGRTMPIERARAELREIHRMPRRISPAGSVLGYAILTVGLGLLQHPTSKAVLGWALLGLGVGVLRLLGARFPVLATAMPVVAATAVTFVALRWAEPLLHMSPGELLIPPLIAFLPGSLLTMGTIELAHGATLSGMARLAGGVNVLLLLAFGILAGITLADRTGLPPGIAADGALGGWAPWAGVVLLGAGFQIFYSARARVLPWVLVCLLAERLAQLAGTGWAGPMVGAFAAGAVIPLLAALVERRTDTPAQVLFLPSFWMLVPGSVGLTGVSELVSGQGASGLDDLVQTLLTMVAITLGIMVGASLLPRRRIRVSDVSPDQGAGTTTSVISP